MSRAGEGPRTCTWGEEDMERIVPGQEETGASRQEGREPPVLSEACSFSTQTFVGKAPKGRDGMYFLSAGETQGEALLLRADAGL